MIDADFVIVGSVVGFTLALAALAWLLHVNYRLAQRNDRLQNDVVILQGAVAEAREVFYRYDVIHRAKNTGDGDKKALVNKDYGDAMAKALEETGYIELGPLQQTLLNLGRQWSRERRRRGPL